jgi:iron(III) transport system permease protein
VSSVETHRRESPPSRRGHPLLHAGGLVLAAAVALPLLYLLIRAVGLAGGPDPAVLLDPETGWALWRSLALAAGVAMFCVLLAVPLAWLGHATDLPGRRFFRVALNLPLAVPSYVSGFVVAAVLGPRGWLQQWLAPLGIERLPDIHGAPGATLALLFTYPYALLPMQAALARMPPALWEAGRSLGLSPTRCFLRIVLPAMRPSMAGGGLLVALYVLSDFGAVSLMRFHSLSYVIYLRYQSLFDRGQAVYLALTLAVLALGVLLLQRMLEGRSRPAVGMRGGNRPWPRIALGRWRWPAFALCAAVALAGLGLPLAVVALWLLGGSGAAASIGALGTETLATLGAGVVSAAFIVTLAMLPALLLRFGDRRMARLVSASSHVGYALPGIVVALSLVYLAMQVVPGIYQTHGLLLFAYAVLFLPLALASLRDGIEGQDPRLYEAARSLGCTTSSAFGRVVIPVARPAIWAGLLVVLLSVIKELPATLLLSPLGFQTLATRIWSLTEDGFFAAAAPAVAVLLLLAGIALMLRPDVVRRQAP